MDYRIEYDSRMLNQVELDSAYFLANRMVIRHGYWSAIYHCMTLMIWCRRNGKNKGRWTDEELSNICFWMEVREVIHRTR